MLYECVNNLKYFISSFINDPFKPQNIGGSTKIRQ